MSYAIVPVEAIRARQDITQGAWDLYLIYCSHRNSDTGRCDPSLETLAAELSKANNYERAVKLRKELIREGWIRMTGKNAVELLKGANEFPPLKVERLQPRRAVKADATVEKAVQTDSFNTLKNCPNEQFLEVENCPNEQFLEEQNLSKWTEKTVQTDRKNCPNEQFLSRSPISEQAKEQAKEQAVEAAVAASANSTTAPAAAVHSNWKQEPCDEEFVEQIKARGLYAEAHIDFVWRKLLFQCEQESAASGKPVQPIKGQFWFWLGKEWDAPKQISLLGGAVVPSSFTPAPARASPAEESPPPASEPIDVEAEEAEYRRNLELMQREAAR